MRKIPQQENLNNNDKLKNRLLNIETEFIAEIHVRMEIFFDSLKGVLFVFEQNPDSDYKQSLNYIALNKVIMNAKNVEEKFISSFKSAFKYYSQGEYNFFINENLHIENFQNSKSKEKDEEYQIVSMLIAKIEDSSEQSLIALSHIYSESANNQKLNFNQLPISPYVLMNSMLASIDGMDLNAGVRMILYNAFDINVLLKLDSIYTNLIEKCHLIKEKPPVKNSVPEVPKVLDTKYIIIEKIFNRLHSLKKYDEIDKPIISKDLILQTLNIIQEKINKKNSSDSSYFVGPDKISKILFAGITKLDKSSVFMKYSKQDLNDIQLVKLFFNYINTDTSIRRVLRLLLLRLQISVLKITLQDNSLFKINTNALRTLITKMSYVPEGFSDELNQNHKYIVKLTEIVDVMLKQTSYSEVFYQKQLDDLNVFIDKMQRKFDLIQKRIKEKEVGLEKINHAKQKVAQILEQKMHKKRMPIFIRDLLLDTWSNVLVLEHLRHPEESRACQSKIEFIELLLNNINKDILENKFLNQLINLFCEGLSLVAYNSKDLKNKKNELLNFLNKKNRRQQTSEELNKLDLNPDPYELILYKKNLLNSEENSSKENYKTDYYDDRVKTLKVGSWLEFVDKDSKKIRAKISWVSPISHNFLMVNSNGVRLADKSPFAIAEGFRNNTCTELHTIPLFDRALLKIAKELNESLK